MKHEQNQSVNRNIVSKSEKRFREMRIRGEIEIENRNRWQKENQTPRLHIQGCRWSICNIMRSFRIGSSMVFAYVSLHIRFLGVIPSILSDESQYGGGGSFVTGFRWVNLFQLWYFAQTWEGCPGPCGRCRRLDKG